MSRYDVEAMRGLIALITEYINEDQETAARLVREFARSDPESYIAALGHTAARWAGTMGLMGPAVRRVRYRQMATISQRPTTLLSSQGTAFAIRLVGSKGRRTSAG